MGWVGFLVSSRAETLNKAIASGSQKVNVDVVQQRDYGRRSSGGCVGGGWGLGVKLVGGWHGPGPRPPAGCVCACTSTHSVNTGKIRYYRDV